MKVLLSTPDPMDPLGGDGSETIWKHSSSQLCLHINQSTLPNLIQNMDSLHALIQPPVSIN